MSEPQQSIVDALQSFLDSRLTDVHTTIPGKIVTYDDIKERATVQPLIKVQRKVNDEIITIEIPPIENVPVMMLHTKYFKLKVPLEKGDGVEIKFSEVGIGNFLNGTGNIVNPDDLSRFSLTDAYCTPGLWGKNLPTNIPTFEVDKLGGLVLLGGTSPFVKGDLLSSNLTTYLTAMSVAGKTAVDPTTVLSAVQAMAVACDVFLAQVPTLNSVKIKGV